MTDIKFEHCIIVCGGGLSENGGPVPWCEERCRVAAEWYHRVNPQTKTLMITTSRGTTHKPMPINESGMQVTESQVYARLLHEKYGIPWDHLVEENVSLDTVGNAYFSRILHLEPLEIQTITVFTSDFHMHRTKIIFEAVFRLQPFLHDFHLEFVSTSNTGLYGTALEARVEKEKASSLSIAKTMESITSMKQMHTFVHWQHMAYACQRMDGQQNVKVADEQVLKSY